MNVNQLATAAGCKPSRVYRYLRRLNRDNPTIGKKTTTGKRSVWAFTTQELAAITAHLKKLAAYSQSTGYPKGMKRAKPVNVPSTWTQARRAKYNRTIRARKGGTV